MEDSVSFDDEKELEAKEVNEDEKRLQMTKNLIEEMKQDENNDNFILGLTADQVVTEEGIL